MTKILHQFLWSRYVVLAAMIFAMAVTARYLALRIEYYADMKIYYQIGFRESTMTKTLVWWETNGLAILAGVVMDLSLALVLALPLVFLGWLLRVPILIALAAFFSANIEHIKYNFANIDFANAGTGLDIHFLRASLTSDAVKYFVAVLVAAAGVWLIMRWKGIRITALAASLLLLATAPVSLASYEHDRPEWMRTQALLPVSFAPRLDIDPRPFPVAALAPEPYGADLAEAEYNILTIYLESVPYKFTRDGTMPYLSDLADRGIEFERLISSNIVTSKGLFATLTGEHAAFTSRFGRWEQIDGNGIAEQGALPRLMKALGYQTAFYQSATLEYMDKANIMSDLGFDIVKGDADWTRAYSRSGWGIDDRALFEHVREELGMLDQSKPWFAAVLTTGSHTPYNIPEDVLDGANPSLERASSYADVALQELLEGLDADGLLERTVVIITADEVRVPLPDQGLQNLIRLNWLPMIILHPDVSGVTISDYLTQRHFRDVVAALAHPTTAEAIEDRFEGSEDIVFGNFLAQRVYWINPVAETFATCKTQFEVCDVFEGLPDPFGVDTFGPSRQVTIPSLLNAIEDFESGVRFEAPAR